VWVNLGHWVPLDTFNTAIGVMLVCAITWLHFLLRELAAAMSDWE